MLHVLHTYIVKLDLEVVLLHLLQVFYLDEVFIWMLQVFNLDVAPSMRDLNVPCNMKQMLRRIFSSLSMDG